jgi:hypothetical protein
MSNKVTRPYPRTAPCFVCCRGDGDQICALIGDDLQDGVAGFGADLPVALRDLADNLEREVGEDPLEDEKVFLDKLHGIDTYSLPPDQQKGFLVFLMKAQDRYDRRVNRTGEGAK